MSQMHEMIVSIKVPQHQLSPPTGTALALQLPKYRTCVSIPPVDSRSLRNKGALFPAGLWAGHTGVLTEWMSIEVFQYHIGTCPSHLVKRGP